MEAKMKQWKRPYVAAAVVAVEALALVMPAGGAWGQAGPAAQSGAAQRAEARRTVDPGRREFESNCAVCHGKSGQGDGSVVELLKRSPPDLTQLSRKNGGVFPIDRVYQTIEGGTVAAHGSREMPIWGRDYRIQGAEYFMDVPYDPEAYVRTRLLWLVEYLSRLQVR
jgi:mono/diheme cytochrome c family protein